MGDEQSSGNSGRVHDGEWHACGRIYDSGPAKAATLLLTTAWFAAPHYAGQGITGVEQAILTGLVFGTIFAVTGRIWMIMIAHSAFDLAALAIIYRGLEPTIAHLVFK